MGSFPTRIGRSAFGPPLENMGGKEGDARFSVGAKRFETMFRQLTGAGLTAPLATASFLSATTTGGLALEMSRLSWDHDPEEAAAPPTLVRSAQGIYLVQFASNVVDVDGNTVPVVFTDACGSIRVPATSGWKASFEVLAPNVVTVTIVDNANAAQDLKSAAPVRAFLAVW